MSAKKQMVMYVKCMVKPNLAKNRLHLHFPCEQMKLAFAQIFQTNPDYAVQLCAQMKHISAELCLQLKEDPVTQHCSLTYFFLAT